MISKIKNWLARIWAGQVNHGHKSTQVGHAGRDVTVINLTQNFSERVSIRKWRSLGPITLEQKAVLQMMKPLPEDRRIKVLEFMRREFETGMVKELNPGEVRRVRAYVSKVIESLD